MLTVTLCEVTDISLHPCSAWQLSYFSCPHQLLIHRVLSVAVGVADSKSISASPHKPARVNEALLLEDMNATLGAADLMIRLMELCPLSPRPLPNDDIGALPAQSYNQTTEGNNTRQHCTAAGSTPAPAVHQPSALPTPKPIQWHDIQLVATKACMSLDWALSLRSAQHTPEETLHRLTAVLCQLIQRRVAGHPPDLDLNMKELFKAGLHAVLAAQLEGALMDEDPASAPPPSELDPMLVDSSLLKLDSVDNEAVLHAFITTIVLHLDSQERWHDFARHGLQSLLRHLGASMQEATMLCMQQSGMGRPQSSITWLFNTLPQASEFCSTPFCTLSRKLNGCDVMLCHSGVSMRRLPQVMKSNCLS